VGEKGRQGKIWNSGTHETEAGKGGYRTNEGLTAENPRLRAVSVLFDALKMEGLKG
jgi:hypothetical protein